MSYRPALALVAVALIAGCGAPSPAAPADPAAAIESAVDEARPDTTADAIDACALVPEADVAALIGDNGGPQAFDGTGGDGGGCTWENPDTYLSVTVDIGQTGTAVGGVLPAWEPALGPEQTLGDEMRLLGPGSVEFASADRLNAVQVVTDPGSDADTDKAVELARSVRAQL